MLKLDIEMVYRIAQNLEWRVGCGLYLIIAGVNLRFGDLTIGERKYQQLWATTDGIDVVWMITARWDRDHDQYLEAFIAGDVDRLSRDWVLLKLMQKDWEMARPVMKKSISGLGITIR